ncbi:hypothetical protein ACHAPX_005375 [Trichoderma viride]
MSSLLPHLNVRRREVKPDGALLAKNYFAVQSALIRGDRNVTLDNTSRILSRDCDALALPYEELDMPQDQEFAYPFADDYSESRSNNTDQPSIVGDYIELFNWDGFRLEWVKVLGQGGFGMATLWNVIFEDESSIKAVIKIPIHMNGTFRDELQWHLRYRGASHVTQSLNLQEIADNVRRRMNREHMINRGTRFDQKRLGILVLEYADHGCLFDIMSKASYFDVHFSNKVLWEIWECLVKGVVSVALQPDSIQQWSPDSLDAILNSLDDPQNADELLKLSTLIDSNDVHFDLEEQNILVAEDDHHSHHPILKFHDFGAYSHKMNQCWDYWEHPNYWRARRCPKNNRTPPETITKDWDKVDISHPGSVLQYTGVTFGPGKNEVAGRYGTWTNIFTIGKIMESVITKSWCSHPMTTMKYEAGDKRCFGDSYAWRLCQPGYDYIEPELLDQIAQCQFERPQDRPSLSYLLRHACGRKHLGFEESDDETRSFWDAFWARTRSNAGGQPPSNPFSDSNATTVVGGDSGSRRDYPSDYPTDRGQREYRSDPFARPSFPLPPAPSPPSRYDEIGNPLITHVAALRRKSRRSLLSVSSKGSLPGPSRRPVFSTDLEATALNPLASSPADNSAPFGGLQKKRPSSGSSSDDSDGGVPLYETKRPEQDLAPASSASTPGRGILRQGTKRSSIASASPSGSGMPFRRTKGTKHNSKTFLFSSSGSTHTAWRVSKRVKKQPVKSVRFAHAAALDDIISTSISDDSTRLNYAWPIMNMAPRRIPNVLEMDVRNGKRLAGYAAISPERLDLPQSNAVLSFTKKSDPSYYESVDGDASRLQFDTTMMQANSTFTPMEVIPEEMDSRMDLD